MRRFLIFTVMLWSSMHSQAQYREGGYEIGEIVADFHLKATDGNTYSLGYWKQAKGFVIVFVSNQCSFCKAYEKRIVSLDAYCHKMGFQLIAINPNDEEQCPADSFPVLVQMVKVKQLKFPYLKDETQIIAKLYGVKRLPEVYVLDRERRLIYFGPLDDNLDEGEVTERYVENTIQRHLEGKLPFTQHTLPIGCSLKWK